MYQAWKNADAELIRVKQNHERNRTSAYGRNSPPGNAGLRGAGGALNHSLSQVADVCLLSFLHPILF